ncbi:MAG TPA: hypothetical protein VFX96_19555, partial [Pyrinomonadaceae bacterium]|nr:hypothetical protein [Pyrinomonadaceae bacterium]
RKRRARKWLWGALAGVTAGALGTTLWLRQRSRASVGRETDDEARRAGGDRWARPGMSITFRAELMPGRSRSERTYRVRELLPSGRVTLDDFTGEHAEAEFEAIR